jgi:hypothetical protein
MKKYSSAIVLTLLVLVIVFAHSCSKKSEEDTPPPADCKTCKAFGNNGSITEKRVCSAAEETAFRNENAGKEISCR